MTNESLKDELKMVLKPFAGHHYREETAIVFLKS